jgi:DNA-binding NarL/FixJ family response regulator
MSEPIRIYLVDDHNVLRAGLRMLLNAEPDMTIVGEAPDVTQAAAEIGGIQPDVVILDLSLPQVHGLEGLSMLQEKTPNSRFLIFTMHNDEQYLRLALAQGALGYVIKQAANEELLSAIRVVNQGGTYLHPAHRGLLFDHENTAEARLASGENNSPDLLSAREHEILILVAMGYTNRQAAEKLFLSEKTIETYKSRLMTKLHLNTRIDLVRYALQHGLIKS